MALLHNTFQDFLLFALNLLHRVHKRIVLSQNVTRQCLPGLFKQ